MSDYIDSQGFRANVGIVLMRDGGELFLGGRRDGRGWQFPQGGVQRNEQPEEALYRELHEEIGLEPSDVELVAGTSRWLRYRLPHQYVRRRGNPVCIGQKQRWFLLRMLGDDSRLNFQATNEPEFDQGRWVDYWAPVREVIYFKRAVYVRALQELGELAFNEGPPPRPEWLTDEMLRAPHPRAPRRRRRSGDGQATAGDEIATDAAGIAEVPAGHEQ
jgi:putative (di)nucleoside polyphosphate hydrolase